MRHRRLGMFVSLNIFKFNLSSLLKGFRASHHRARPPINPIGVSNVRKMETTLKKRPGFNRSTQIPHQKWMASLSLAKRCDSAKGGGAKSQGVDGWCSWPEMLIDPFPTRPPPSTPKRREKKKLRVRCNGSGHCHGGGKWRHGGPSALSRADLWRHQSPH